MLEALDCTCRNLLQTFSLDLGRIDFKPEKRSQKKLNRKNSCLEKPITKSAGGTKPKHLKCLPQSTWWVPNTRGKAGPGGEGAGPMALRGCSQVGGSTPWEQVRNAGPPLYPHPILDLPDLPKQMLQGQGPAISVLTNLPGGSVAYSRLKTRVKKCLGCRRGELFVSWLFSFNIKGKLGGVAGD